MQGLASLPGDMEPARKYGQQGVGKERDIRSTDLIPSSTFHLSRYSALLLAGSVRVVYDGLFQLSFQVSFANVKVQTHGPGTSWL